MLLFSAQLEISNAMTKEAFVRLAIEWNQGSPHVENRIQGINWNGEYNVRYGTENLWLAIETSLIKELFSFISICSYNTFKSSAIFSIALSNTVLPTPRNP